MNSKVSYASRILESIELNEGSAPEETTNEVKIIEKKI